MIISRIQKVIYMLHNKTKCSLIICFIHLSSKWTNQNCLFVTVAFHGPPTLYYRYFPSLRVDCNFGLSKLLISCFRLWTLQQSTGASGQGTVTTEVPWSRYSCTRTACDNARLSAKHFKWARQFERMWFIYTCGLLPDSFLTKVLFLLKQ